MAIAAMDVTAMQITVVGGVMGVEIMGAVTGVETMGAVIVGAVGQNP